MLWNFPHTAFIENRSNKPCQHSEVRAMTVNDTTRTPVEEPLAELERQLIGAYVAGAGEELEALLARDDEGALQLLAEASLYASVRLTEVESRSHYLHKLRGEE
jgi:hypothetical protein